MTALTVWSGFSGGTPEIDLEIQGQESQRSTLMHPIWAPGQFSSTRTISDPTDMVFVLQDTGQSLSVSVAFHHPSKVGLKATAVLQPSIRMDGRPK